MRRVLPFLFLLAACGPEERVASTQVTLRVELPDRTLEPRIDEVRATLFVRGADGWSERSHTSVPKKSLKFPFDIPILPSREYDQTAELDVRVEALDADGNQVASTRAAGRFKRNENIGIRSRLAACTKPDPVCPPNDCYGAECQMCVLDACVPVSGASVVEGDGDEPSDDPTDDTEVDAGVADGGKPSDRDGSTSGSDGGTAPDAATAIACTAEQVKECPQPYPCVPLSKGGFTCRGQLANWPIPDAVAGAKFAPKYRVLQGTVLDEHTKLEWQTSLPLTYPGCDRSDAEIGAAQQGSICSRAQGEAYCKGLRDAGHDDWRLPTMIELVSLLGAEGAPPTLDEAYFGDTTSYHFISSSWGAGPAESWVVIYDYVGVWADPNAAGRVRCVRAGAEPPFAKPSDRYEVMGEVVRDRATTLVWQRKASSKVVTDAERKTYCATQGPGFRLPTPNELWSLLDPTRRAPWVDPVAFPNSPSAEFMNARGPIVYTDFDDGSIQTTGYGDGYVRCVRNE